MGQRKLASEQLELRELLALTTIDLVEDLTIAEGTHRDITLDHISGPTSVLVGLKIKGTGGNFDPGVPLIHEKDNPSQIIPLVSSMANVNGTTDSLVFFQMGTATLTIEVGGTGGGEFQAEIFLFGDSDGDGGITETEYMKASAAQMQAAGTGNANTAMYYKSVWGIDFNQSQYDYEFDLNQDGKVDSSELNWVKTNQAGTGVQLDLIGDIDPPTITSTLAPGLDSAPMGFPGPNFGSDGVTNALPAIGDVAISGTITDFSNITSATISGTAGSINLFTDTIAQKDLSNPRALTYGLSRTDLITLFGSDVFTADNTFVLKINASDDLGNTYATPLSFTYTYDMTDPAAPSLVDLTTDTGVSATDNITKATAVSFDVTVEAGTIVELLYRAEAAGTFTSIGKIYDSGQTGKVTFNLPNELNVDGKYIFKAVSYDVAGNDSGDSAELTIEIDRNIASPVVTELDNKTTAALLTDQDHAELTVTSVETGASVTINGITIVDGSVDDLDPVAGQVKFSSIPLAAIGKNTLQVTSTDIAGNSTSSPLNLTVVRNTKPELDTTSLNGKTLGESTPDNVYNGSALAGFNILFEAGTTDAGETYSYQVATTLLDVNSAPLMIDTTGLVVTITNGAVSIADPNKVLNYENGVRFVKLDVTVTDNKFDGSGGAGLSDTESFTIALDDLNETPTLTPSTISGSINENAAATTPVVLTGMLTAADPDNADGLNLQTLTYAFAAGGNPTGLFEIDGVSGEITLKTSDTLNFEATKSYDLMVVVSDGTINSAPITVTVNVNDVNEAPVFNGAPYGFSIAEDLTSGVVDSVSATDPDAADDTPTATNPLNATLTYSFTGTLDSRFAINGATGEISIVANSAFDYETEPTINLEVLVEDAGSPVGSHTAMVTITVTDVNEAPVFDEISYSGDIDENILGEDVSAAAAINIGTAISATDQDSPAQTLTYSFATNGDGGGKFSIDPTTGVISRAAGQALDRETTASYTLEVMVTDNGMPAKSSTVMVEVTVNNVNEAPVLNQTLYTISEIALVPGVMDIGLAVDYTDVDQGDTVTFIRFLGDSAEGIFELSFDGKISFIGASTPVPNDYLIHLKGQDLAGLFFEDSITIRVVDNLPPVPTQQEFSIDENLANDTSVFDLTFTDNESNALTTVTIDSYLTLDAVGAFKVGAINGNSVSILVNDASKLDFEAYELAGVSFIEFKIKATDSVGSFGVYTIKVNLNDLNDAPVYDGDVVFTIDEFVAAIPPTAGTPGADTPISPGLDLSLAFTDADASDAGNLIFSIDSTTDPTGIFGIVGGNVVVVNPSLIDFESGTTSYNLKVEANDGDVTTSQSITINVNQRNELPLPLDGMGEPIIADVNDDVNLGNVTLSFAALNALNDGDPLPGGVNIYSILNFGPNGSASDPEGDTLAFLQTMTNADKFTIASNGDITITDTDFLASLGDSEVFELSFTYTDDNADVLTSTDLGANLIKFTFTIVKNALPDIDNVSATSVTIAENSASESATTPILTFDVTDTDAGDMITSVTASAPGIANGIFKVVHVSGSQYQLVVDSPTNLDYEAIFNSIASDTFTVTITATDSHAGSSTTMIDVTVTDVNEAPTMSAAEFPLTVAENSAGGTVVGQVVATDPDAADAGNMLATNGADFATLAYSLSGPDAANFQISSTGEITVKAGADLDFEDNTKNYFEFQVHVTDLNGGMGGLSSGFSTVKITVTDLNDAPEWTGEAAAMIVIDESQLVAEQNVTLQVPNGQDTTARDGYELRFALSEIVDSLGNPIFTDVDAMDTLELEIDSAPAYVTNDSFFSYTIENGELVVRVLHYLPSQSRAPKTITIHAKDSAGAISASADLTLKFKVENIVDVQIRAVKQLSAVDGTHAGENITKEMLQQSDASLLVTDADLDSTFFYEIWVSTNYGINDAAPGRVYFDGAALLNLNLQYNEDILDILPGTFQQLGGTSLPNFGPAFKTVGSDGYVVGIFGLLSNLQPDTSGGGAPTIEGNGAFSFPEVASGEYLRFASIGFKLNNTLPTSDFNGELISLYYDDPVAINTPGNGAIKILLDPVGFTGDGNPILTDTEIAQNTLVGYGQLSEASTQMELVTDFLIFELNGSPFTLNLTGNGSFNSNFFNNAFTAQSPGGSDSNVSGKLYVQILEATQSENAKLRIVAADLDFDMDENYTPGDPPDDNATTPTAANFGLESGTRDFAFRNLHLSLSDAIEIEISTGFAEGKMGTFDSQNMGLYLSAGVLHETRPDADLPGQFTPSTTQLAGAAVDSYDAESGTISSTDGGLAGFADDDIVLNFNLKRLLVDAPLSYNAALLLQLFGQTSFTATYDGNGGGVPLMGTVSANGGQPLEAGSGVFLSVVDAPTALDASGQIAALPVNETWLSEWDTFWVEIWANTADAAGIQSGAVDLKYNTDLFTATRIEYSSKFDQNRSGLINDGAGLITNLGSGTVSSDLGKDGFVLLGRVQFQSLINDGLSIEDGLQYGPADLGLEITRGQLELSEIGMIRAATSENLNIDVWAVPYDLDDDGVISMIDLSQFIRRIGTSSIAVEDAITAATDFNNDGYTSIVDLSDLVRNLGVSKANASQIKYPTSFTQLWVGAGLVTNGPDSIGSIFNAANAAWAEALGLDKPLDVRLEVTNLGGAQLGEAKLVGLNTEGLPVRGVLTIDNDGAGFGWSTDLENGPGNSQYDLYTVMLHELGHLYGFMPQYSAFAEHVTDFEGSTIFVGDMYAVELDSRGEHLDVDTYASDVMSPYLAPGVRKEISALDAQMILTAYSSADSTTTISGSGAHLTEQSAAGQPDVQQATTLVSPVSETTTVEINVFQAATSFVLGDSVANLADVSGRTGVPVVMSETTRQTLEQSGIAFKTLSNYSAVECDNVSAAMTEVGTYFDDSTLIESTISDLESDADDSNDGESIDDLFADWDEVEMA